MAAHDLPMMVPLKTPKAKLAQPGMSSAPGLGLGRNLRACMVCSVILPTKARPPIYPIASTGRKAVLTLASGFHRPRLSKLRRSRAVQRLSGGCQRLHILKLQRRDRVDRPEELVGGQVAAAGFVCTRPLCGSGSRAVARRCAERVDSKGD